MTDLRPYAERIAKACPERFFLETREGNQWGIYTGGDCFWHDHPSWKWWAFIGPLLDELRIDPILWLGQWQGKSQEMTWLEAAFAAVAAELETKVPK